MGKHKGESFSVSKESLVNNLEFFKEMLASNKRTLASIAYYKFLQEVNALIAEEASTLHARLEVIPPLPIVKPAQPTVSKNLGRHVPKRRWTSIVIKDDLANEISGVKWVDVYRQYILKIAENPFVLIKLKKLANGGAFSDKDRPEVTTRYEQLAENLWFSVSMHSEGIKSALRKIDQQLEINITVEEIEEKLTYESVVELIKNHSNSTLSAFEVQSDVPVLTSLSNFSTDAQNDEAKPLFGRKDIDLLTYYVLPNDVLQWRVEDWEPYFTQGKALGVLTKMSGRTKLEIETWLKSNLLTLDKMWEQSNQFHFSNHKGKRIDELCLLCSKEVLEKDAIEDLLSSVDSIDELLENFNSSYKTLGFLLKANHINIWNFFNREDYDLESEDLEDLVLHY